MRYKDTTFKIIIMLLISTIKGMYIPNDVSLVYFFF